MLTDLLTWTTWTTPLSTNDSRNHRKVLNSTISFLNSRMTKNDYRIVKMTIGKKWKKCRFLLFKIVHITSNVRMSESRQYKNYSTESKNRLIFKLPRFSLADTVRREIKKNSRFLGSVESFFIVLVLITAIHELKSTVFHICMSS